MGDVLSSTQSKKVAEGLGRPKETYDNVSSSYAQERLRDTSLPKSKSKKKFQDTRKKLTTM